MEIPSIGNQSAANPAEQRLGLSQEDFLKVLLAQLTFQDPLEPLDNKDFMAQLAQFTSLEQSRQMNDKLDSLLLFQSSNQGIGLIGRTVEVATNDGAEVGQVIASVMQRGIPTLTIRAGETILNDIRLSQIRIVR